MGPGEYEGRQVLAGHMEEVVAADTRIMPAGEGSEVADFDGPVRIDECRQPGTDAAGKKLMAPARVVVTHRREAKRAAHHCSPSACFCPVEP